MRDTTNWPTMRNVLLIAAVACAATGCASGRAQILEDRPALVVPPPPPRAIEPPPAAEAPPVEPLPEVAPPPTTTAKPAARSNRSPESKPEPKPEPPPETAPPLPNPPPVAGLRTPTTPSGPEATRQIREALDRARAALTKIDFQRLSDDRQANYRAAQSFIEQGWDALKKDDIALARSFAKRAEDIARQLETGR
jgi:outer membrane biosynthesis protein TonB